MPPHLLHLLFFKPSYRASQLPISLSFFLSFIATVLQLFNKIRNANSFFPYFPALWKSFLHTPLNFKLLMRKRHSERNALCFMISLCSFLFFSWLEQKSVFRFLYLLEPFRNICLMYLSFLKAIIYTMQFVFQALTKGFHVANSWVSLKKKPNQLFNCQCYINYLINILSEMSTQSLYNFLIKMWIK